MDGSLEAVGTADDTSQGAHTFAVAVDGSRLANIAVEFTCSLLNKRLHGDRKLHDTVYAMHITDERKGHPAQLAPERVKNKAENTGGEYNLDLKWFDESQHDGRSTGETLCHMAGEKKVQFLVVGLFGHTNEKSKLLGDCSRCILKEKTAADVFVVKNTSLLPKKGEPEVWCVASDFSENACHALDVVLTLMAKTDKLYIFHASKYEAFASQVEKKHMAQVANKNREAEFVNYVLEGGAHMGDVLCKFCAHKEVHVLALGHQGNTRSLDAFAGHASGHEKASVLERHIGSTGDYCLANANTSVLIVKTAGQHKNRSAGTTGKFFRESKMGM